MERVPSHASRRAIIWCIHLCAFALCGILAFLIRFEFDLRPRDIAQMALAVPIWVVVKAIVFHCFRLDRGAWRYVSIPDVLRIGTANLIGSALSAFAIILAVPGGFPRSTFILDCLLCGYITVGVRLLARIIRDRARRGRTPQRGTRVVIYGAGNAGVRLLREIRETPELAYEVCGFVDDQPAKTGISVHLVPVLGTGDHLAQMRAAHEIDEVLIAIPSASGPAMVRILQRCKDAGLRCKTIPGLSELVEGARLAAQIRDVAVEDLLSRTPIELDQTRIRAKLQHKTVVITGAAGSIGSELCRQIARFQPQSIVGIDIAETALFLLEREMRAAFPDIPFHPEIGNIQNPQRLAEIFEHHRPSVLYHAAAYKHVPMMEAHLFEAVENNLLGTSNVALAAAEYGVGDFVMISSDKAVRPTGIMGMTKRAAELLINSLRCESTKFVAVRFGNVLGSNGSVIPLFKSQIAAGGPVTVTHPEMRRYFMTIPEAAQLVLQASTMGKGGEVFVLDMGEPVKILDLARNLILLSGLRPNDDVAIEFTGMRPGEKLFEELNTSDENIVPTYHEKIKIFSGNRIPPEGMAPHMRTIRHLCAAREAQRLMLELKELVPEYNPSSQVLRQLFSEQAGPAWPQGATTALASAQ